MYLLFLHITFVLHIPYVIISTFQKHIYESKILREAIHFIYLIVIILYLILLDCIE